MANICLNFNTVIKFHTTDLLFICLNVTASGQIHIFVETFSELKIKIISALSWSWAGNNMNNIEIIFFLLKSR